MEVLLGFAAWCLAGLFGLASTGGPRAANPSKSRTPARIWTACAGAWEVGNMFSREVVLGLCRHALTRQCCCASGLGERAWPKPCQKSNKGPTFESTHNCECSDLRPTMLEQLHLAASSGGAKMVSGEHEIAQNSNTGYVLCYAPMMAKAHRMLRIAEPSCLGAWRRQRWISCTMCKPFVRNAIESVDRLAEMLSTRAREHRARDRNRSTEMPRKVNTV